MTKDVVAVQIDLPLIDAARIMYEKKFNGLPVVNREEKLVGLLTQQDLVIRTHAVHLPTLIDLLSQIHVYKQNTSIIKDDLKKIVSLKVSDVMNRNPVVVGEGADISEVAEIFANHHAVNPIPVVGRNGELTGIVSRYDVLKFFVGASPRHVESETKEAEVDHRIGKFVEDFEKRFLFVSRAQTTAWFWLAVAFGIGGFFIAWAWILRIVTR